MRNMYLCCNAKIMTEGKMEKTILGQQDSCKRKQPIFEKIARQLQEEVEYKTIQSTHGGRQAYLHHTL